MLCEAHGGGGGLEQSQSGGHGGHISSQVVVVQNPDTVPSFHPTALCVRMCALTQMTTSNCVNTLW